MAALSEEDRARAIAILEQVRAEIAAAAEEDVERKFQLRRYVVKRLEFDERGTPTERKRLKVQKRKLQRGLCGVCGCGLPERGAELHRLKAVEGYTAANTMLLCHECHGRAQAEMAL